MSKELFLHARGQNAEITLSRHSAFAGLDGSAAVSGLIADLAHFADQNGIDFNEALRVAQLTYFEQRALEAAFPVGCLVTLTDQAIGDLNADGLPHTGQIVQRGFPHGQPTQYAIYRIGVDPHQIVTEDQLRPAAPFPDIPYLEMTISSIEQAELALVAAYAEQLLDREEGRAEGNLAFTDDLLSAVADWSHVTRDGMANLLMLMAERAVGIADTTLADLTPVHNPGAPPNPTSGPTRGR